MRPIGDLTETLDGRERRGAVLAPATRHVTRMLGAGLLILTPAFFTIVVLKTVLGFLDGLMAPALDWAFRISAPGTGIIALLVLLYVAGVVDANMFGHALLQRARRIALAIPGVRIVYAIGTQITEAFSPGRPTGFQRVVTVEYPREGAWAIGFLAGFTTVKGVRHVIVYVPTSPLPNSGWMGLFAPEEVYDVDMTISQAMEAVFSGGLVFPERLSSVSVAGGQGAPIPEGLPVMEPVAEPAGASGQSWVSARPVY